MTEPTTESRSPRRFDRSSGVGGYGFRVTVLGICAFAAGLRLARLGSEGLWNDECATAIWARLPGPELLAALRVDNHAPLFFFLERAVTAVLGYGEAALRLLPALAGIATVGLAAVVGARIVSRRAGLLAALLLAISPLHLHYSQEAKSYALQMLLALAVFGLAHRLHETRSTRVALVLGLVAALDLYTHNVGLFVVGGVFVAYVAFERGWQGYRPWLLAGATALLAYLPWLGILLRQASVGDASYAWLASSWRAEFPWQILRSLAALSHGSLPPVRNHVTQLGWNAWIGLGIALLLAAAGLAVRRRWALRDAALRLPIAVVLPLAGLFVYSIVFTPVYVVGRVDAAVLPLLVILIASGTEAMRPRLRALVPLAFIGLAILPLELLMRVDHRSQERTITASLREAFRPGDVLVSTGFNGCLRHYLEVEADAGLLMFPSQLEQHPEWIDWSQYDETRLVADAEAVSTAAGAALRRRSGRSICLISRDEAREAPIARALAGRLQAAEAYDLRYLGYRLRRYERARLTTFPQNAPRVRVMSPTPSGPDSGRTRRGLP